MLLSALSEAQIQLIDYFFKKQLNQLTEQYNRAVATGQPAELVTSVFTLSFSVAVAETLDELSPDKPILPRPSCGSVLSRLTQISDSFRPNSWTEVSVFVPGIAFDRLPQQPLQ